MKTHESAKAITRVREIIEQNNVKAIIFGVTHFRRVTHAYPYILLLTLANKQIKHFDGEVRQFIQTINPLIPFTTVNCMIKEGRTSFFLSKVRLIAFLFHSYPLPQVDESETTIASREIVRELSEGIKQTSKLRHDKTLNDGVAAMLITHSFLDYFHAK